MKKQKTLLIFTVIIAIVVIGGYLAIGVVNEKNKNNEEKANSAAPVEENLMLTDMEDVTYVQYKNAEATVTLERSGVLWTNAEDKEMVLVSGYVDEKVGVLSKIKGTPVTDATKAECGLENPIYALTIKDAENTVQLVIGVSQDGVCYAMVDGGEEIYNIAKEVVDALNTKIEDLAENEDDEHIDSEKPVVDESKDEAAEPTDETSEPTDDAVAGDDEAENVSNKDDTETE